MKRYIVTFVLMFSFWAGAAHAADLTFTQFHADITIQSDASIAVTETMTANFATPHHGIFRTIPFDFSTLSGDHASIPITVTTVTQDGQTAKYALSSEGANLEVKIGDPNQTISGSHEYVITYTALAATNFFSDHDELFWNVTGEQWDAPLSNISAAVHFAPSVMDAAGDPPTVTQIDCYTGDYRSTEHNCQSTRSGSTATFSSNEFLTIVVGWPTGFVTKPADFDQVRQSGGTAPAQSSSAFPNFFHGWAGVINVAAPLVALMLMWLLWQQRGRDPQGKKTIIAQYEPPKDMRPAEVGFLVNQNVQSTALSATIVDLAVHGHIRIREVETSAMLGLSHKKDYQLELLQQDQNDLRDYEKKLLNALFSNTKLTVTDTAANTVLISQFSKKPKARLAFKDVRDGIDNYVTQAGYFSTDPVKARATPLVIAGILAYCGFQFGFLAPGLIVSAVVIGAFGWLMPSRTELGVEALWQARGFKLFLEKAEQYRLQWQEKENIFEQYLPYAMVFGVAEKWSKALAPMLKDAPEWYVGSTSAQFNALVFYSTLNGFTHSFSTSVVSGAASGSSGFGGGGFSGGGGGGGGGGGW